MSQVIRIPAEVYSRLAKFAKGFDTPVNVIERLLYHYENCEQVSVIDDEILKNPIVSSVNQNRMSDFNKRDITKYLFNGNTYGKGRLVLAVVTAYVNSNPETSLGELQAIFPRRLQGSTGVFDGLDKAQGIYERTGHKRHYLNSNEVLQLSDATIAVGTQWGAGNIDNFIDKAESLGYEITRVSN